MDTGQSDDSRRSNARGLAEFAQQGPEHETHVKNLLADPALMKQMLEAGGAKFGKYGRAMENLHGHLWKLSPKVREGLLQRLALSVALEHAQPLRKVIPSINPTPPQRLTRSSVTCTMGRRI